MTVTAERFGSLVIDRDAIEVRLDGEVVPLTKTEFLLLDALTRHPRRAMTNQVLFQAIWGSEWVDDGALQTQVSRLRAKLGESGTSPRMIVTVHRFGYRFEPGSETGSTPATPLPGESVMFGLIDLNRRPLWMGGDVEAITGYAVSDFDHMNFYEMAHPEDAPMIFAAREDINRGIPTGMRFRIQHRSGTYRTIEAFVRPVVGPDGNPTSILAEWRLAGSGEVGTIDSPEPIRYH